jgi:hypothetical protein
MSDPHTPVTSEDDDASVSNEDTEPSRVDDFPDSPETDISFPGDEYQALFPREDFYCVQEALSQAHMAPIPIHNLKACTLAASTLLKRMDR